MVPIEGFGIKLTFAAPAVVAAGEDRDAGGLPGMAILMHRMAQILRAEHVDFRDVMRRAVDSLVNEKHIDMSALLTAMNRVREASGEPPLVSAEEDVSSAIQIAVENARIEWARGEEARMADRMRAAIEADRASRDDQTQVAADPPPPRGAPQRRKAG